MSISDKYVSPNTRWAILLNDHPGANFEFREGLASEFGVPAEWGGDETVVVATITFPPESGLEPVSAYKELVDTKGRPITREDRTPGTWNVLCTKALGRACTRAGYPASTPDLKALVLWRQRNAEVAAIGSGVAEPPALGAGTPDAPDAFDEASVPDPDHVDAETTGVDEDIVDAVVVDEPTAPTEPADDGASEDSMAAIRSAMGKLGRRQADVSTWAKAEGIPWPRRITEAQAQQMLAHIASLDEAADAAA